MEEEESSDPPIAAIAGGVAAGVAVVVGIVAWFFCCRKRNDSTSKTDHRAPAPEASGPPMPMEGFRPPADNPLSGNLAPPAYSDSFHAESPPPPYDTVLR